MLISSMPRCNPYFEPSIRHVMLLLKNHVSKIRVAKSFYLPGCHSVIIHQKENAIPSMPPESYPDTKSGKSSYLMIQKLPSPAFPIPDHPRNSRNDQENKSLIPYYKKFIPIPPSFFCTLLFGVSVFSFFYFLPLHVLHLDHDKNKRNKVAHPQMLSSPILASNESRDKKKSPDKCPWPG